MLQFLPMKKANVQAPFPHSSLQQIIKQQINTLTPRIAKHRFQLRYSLKNLFPLPHDLLTQLIIFLLQGRFPLLFQQSQSLGLQSRKIKEMYQLQLKKSKLTDQNSFEQFLIIAIKTSKKITEQLFEQVLVSMEEEQELYSLSMKVLLGIQVFPSCYKIIIQRYVNQDIFDINQIQLKPKRQMNDSHGTKRMITMNSIQNKLQKRKLKKTKNERPSLMMFPTNKSLENFKEDLNKSLKVQPPKKNEIVRQRYCQLQDLTNIHGVVQKSNENIKERKPRKKVLYTEQTSSSVKLKLILKQQDHSDRKRNILLRYSSPSPHLTHRIYDTSKNQISQAARLPRLNQRKSTKGGNVLRKTGSYWKKVKEEIREMNSMMLY